MSQITYSRLSAMAIGIIGANALAIDAALAKGWVGIIDRSPVRHGRGLDIGLQPIIPTRVTRAPAIERGMAIGLAPIIPFKLAQTPTPDRSIATSNRQPLGVGIAAKVGTLGFGVDASKSLTPQLNARLGVNFGNVGFNRTDSGINYDAQLKLSSIQLFGDYYPSSNSSFRITGGFVAQNNRVAVTSKPSGNGTYTIAGNQYAASSVGTLNGEYAYGNSIAPYLGIGIGKSTNEGLGFNADLGLMFTGSPKVSLTASNPAFNDNATTRAQIDNQARQTENDLRGFNVYPVISVGVSYGF
ncbi:hypothetical protein [Chamaesiphon sp. VAR_69_metabat_338]|uniref:hypothetical protein n=1 Tax=Chamaesiphon sp. VAR_69_metabat_338 TaxID=2964704 RepID=UPI00286D9570|nr:hypothetical protein [Chamaesiphon sp. VAR_69_metabat_338]